MCPIVWIFFCLKQEVFLIRSGHNKTMLSFLFKNVFLSFKFSVISPLKRAHSTLPDVNREHGVGYVIIWHCLIYYHCFYYLDKKKSRVGYIFLCKQNCLIEEKEIEQLLLNDSKAEVGFLSHEYSKMSATHCGLWSPDLGKAWTVLSKVRLKIYAEAEKCRQEADIFEQRRVNLWAEPLSSQEHHSQTQLLSCNRNTCSGLANSSDTRYVSGFLKDLPWETLSKLISFKVSLLGSWPVR